MALPDFQPQMRREIAQLRNFEIQRENQERYLRDRFAAKLEGLSEQMPGPDRDQMLGEIYATYRIATDFGVQLPAEALEKYHAIKWKYLPGRSADPANGKLNGNGGAAAASSAQDFMAQIFGR